MTETTTTTETVPDVLALPNVSMDKNMTASATANMSKRTIRLVWVLATTYPLWSFKWVGYRTVEVSKDGEALGTVGEEWYGSNNAVFVRNHRIADKNQRSNAYHTQDLSKAVLKVKKMFSPKTLAERVKAARELAGSVITDQWRDKNHERRRFASLLDGSRLQFARTMETQFLLWLGETNNKAMLETIHKYEQMTAEMQTIEGVNKALENNKSALVVLADGKYIVKILDSVQLYDDTTLPENLRGKLGMLKLVEAEQMVTGIGCRVNNETFVLILENEDENSETKTESK